MAKSIIKQFSLPLGIILFLLGFYPFSLWLQGVLRALGVLLGLYYYWKREI